MRLHHFAAYALIVTLPAVAPAHHGWSTYDSTQTVTVDAAVKEIRWANPHGAISIDYKGAQWNVLLAPLSRMESRGLNEAMLKPGTKVTLIGQPRSDGTKELKIQRIVVGGKTYNLLA